MKTLRYLLAALVMPFVAHAQIAGTPNQTPSFTVTTLSAALTATAGCFNVASTTGFVVGYGVMIDQEQIYPIRTINTTSNQICGTRGYSSRATAHGSGRSVVVAPAPNFQSCVGNGCGVLNNESQYVAFSSGPFLPTTYIATSSGATTLTAGAVLGGWVFNTPGGAINVTLPTAELLLAAIPGATVGTTVPLTIRNLAAMTDAITIVAGTGGTFGAGGGTATVAAAAQKDIRIRFTSVVPGAATYQVYSMGSTTY